MAENHLKLTLSDADETADFAVRLGVSLGAGDVILLSGDVGAGKTHFARALIQSRLAVSEDVPSPTFTLVQTYEAESIEIWHADLYRLTSTQEVEELGLIEAFETAICLIEWPDRLGPLAPANALSLTFDPGATEDARQLSAHWHDPKWDERLQDWRS